MLHYMCDVCVHVCACSTLCMWHYFHVYMFTHIHVPHFLVAIAVSRVKVESLEYGNELVEGGHNLTEDSIVHRWDISWEELLNFVYNCFFFCFWCCLSHLYIRVRYAEIRGTKYCKGYVVVCYIEHEMPVFGQIADIILLPTSVCVFVLKPFMSTSFNPHFHAFEVTPVREVLLYQQHEFADFHPLFISKSFLSPSPLFIRCKYFMCEQWMLTKAKHVYICRHPAQPECTMYDLHILQDNYYYHDG